MVPGVGAGKPYHQARATGTCVRWRAVHLSPSSVRRHSAVVV